MIHYSELFRSKTSNSNQTAAKILLQTILVKQYGNSGDMLISEADI
jgi:hypothetical protein